MPAFKGSAEERARNRVLGARCYEKKKALGICRKCSRPAMPGASACLPCRLRRRVKKYLKRRAAMARMYARQGGRCRGCRHVLPIHVFEIDHIIPRARGGGSGPRNLQLLCPACNGIKWTMTMAEAEAEGAFDHLRADAPVHRGRALPDN